MGVIVMPRTEHHQSSDCVCPRLCGGGTHHIVGLRCKVADTRSALRSRAGATLDTVLPCLACRKLCPYRIDLRTRQQSENNPFRVGMTAGPGGKRGKPIPFLPFMRTRQVRAAGKHGIQIPSDTHFLRADGRRRTVRLWSRQTRPSQDGLGARNSSRCGALTRRNSPHVRESSALHRQQATAHARERSADWSQVRPRGLSVNTSLYRRRDLTRD